jgi:predicted DNA-binding transcriptional regulator AlpA
MSNLPAASAHDSCTAPSTTPEAANSRLILEGFLRREELAKQLNLSPRTIDRWQASREGPPRVHVGRTILYNVQSVREWLQSRERVRSAIADSITLARMVIDASKAK